MIYTFTVNGALEDVVARSEEEARAILRYLYDSDAERAPLENVRGEV